MQSLQSVDALTISLLIALIYTVLYLYFRNRISIPSRWLQWLKSPPANAGDIGDVVSI